VEPISMILLAMTLFGGGAAAAGVVAIAYLTIRDVMSWFRERRHRLRNANVAATVIEHLNNGQYRTVQGILNQNTNAWVEHRIIESADIDAELTARHRGRRLVIHTV
jgi:hypothetical protein